MIGTRSPAAIQQPERTWPAFLAWPKAGLILAATAILSGCFGCVEPDPAPPGTGEPDWKNLRLLMVREQIEDRGVRDPRVLQAMGQVPRHLFLPEDARLTAYGEAASPIGHGQTTPQPYIVALMAELLEITPGARVLEVGTGTGYQAAVLAAMGAEVFSIEIRPRLCASAAALLAELGYVNAHIHCGDGYGGWPEEAPFSGIMVTVAPTQIPDPLLDQLAEGGNMVIPLGPFYQDLKVITRTAEGFEERPVIPVRFPPIDRERAEGGLPEDRDGGGE